MKAQRDKSSDDNSVPQYNCKGGEASESGRLATDAMPSTLLGVPPAKVKGTDDE